MKVIVDKHNIKIIKNEDINENEANIQKIEFEFSDDYINFLKYALLSYSDKVEKIIIANNEINMPLFEEEQTVLLGVYAEKIIDDKLCRLNPTPKLFCIEKGSMQEAENHKEITPSEFEQYMQLMNDALEDIPNKIKEKIDSYDFDNINFDEYVKKESGKGLSTNDFTKEDKQKLDSLNNYDDVEIRREIEGLNDEIKNISLVPGPQGPPGEDGANGMDGYTPQKGIDYWTAEDFDNIKQHCNNYIDDNYLSLLGGSY